PSFPTRRSSDLGACAARFLFSDGLKCPEPARATMSRRRRLSPVNSLPRVGLVGRARLTRGLGGCRGKARAHREACQLRGAVETQREAQALALPVYGPGAHAQHLRNLARAIAERHLAQDLPLALGEVRRAVVEIPIVARRDPQAHLGSDRAIPAARGDLLQRPQQLLAAVLLQHVAERP